MGTGARPSSGRRSRGDLAPSGGATRHVVGSAGIGLRPPGPCRASARLRQPRASRREERTTAWPRYSGTTLSGPGGVRGRQPSARRCSCTFSRPSCRTRSQAGRAGPAERAHARRARRASRRMSPGGNDGSGSRSRACGRSPRWGAGRSRALRTETRGRSCPPSRVLGRSLRLAVVGAEDPLPARQKIRRLTSSTSKQRRAFGPVPRRIRAELVRVFANVGLRDVQPTSDRVGP